MIPAVVDPSGLQRYSDRVVDGIAAVFLALKRRPVIRYQRTYDTAKRIAHETAVSVKLWNKFSSGVSLVVLRELRPQYGPGFDSRWPPGNSHADLLWRPRPKATVWVLNPLRTRSLVWTTTKLMYQHESGLFDFRRTESSPLLLVIDRRDDPIAQSVDMSGLQDNKVDLRAIGSLSKDQQVEVVLSSEQDAFFKSNMYENFGDIGMNIKRMVDDFQQVAKSNQNIQTVEDMARFVDNYPEYKKMQGNVSRHVTLVTEMSKLVEARKLMLVSQTEQDLACNGAKELHMREVDFSAVTDLLNNENVSEIDRLRLVMLYALRYEKENPVQLMQLFNKLASRSPKYKPGLVQFLLKQASVEKRTGDLFGNRDLMNIACNMARGLKIIFNTDGRPQEVVIFMVGGTTHEESRSVALQNATNSGIRFILGGTAVLNSKRFLMDLEEAQRISRSGSHMV
ncbi:hypothetical protein Bca101_098766 [Brassica carinata]